MPSWLPLSNPVAPKGIQPFKKRDGILEWENLDWSSIYSTHWTFPNLSPLLVDGKQGSRQCSEIWPLKSHYCQTDTLCLTFKTCRRTSDHICPIDLTLKLIEQALIMQREKKTWLLSFESRLFWLPTRQGFLELLLLNMTHQHLYPL